MGGPMVERLLAAGFPVHLFARRPETQERFRALGAVIEPSPAAVAASADLLIVCPFSEAQLEEITEHLLAHGSAGTVLVQHATVSWDGIRRLAARGTSAGITVLDAPISGTSASILAGELTVLMGGDAEAASRAAPALAAYASTVVRTGDVGSATAVKLVNNLTFAAHAQIAVSAVELGEALGVAPEDLLAALSVSSAASTALGHLRALGSVERFATMAAPYLGKDVAFVEVSAARAGVDTGLLGATVRNGRLTLSAPAERSVGSAQ
ncbi:3-hydroxyisobutyrate dehydrogenase [Cryptosporangium aurantiacum]|uniref:3-hydroxyisobutyrate dehydrogenase n=2 Tax=Cryptosporangium aurantiacum TaxID=134849 RepID=A0A1M7PFM8_9ACTN|nr:3-hydroxyisobutyrate dehydrogenase [Cryptosporangium aurantiacum]